MCGVYLYVCPYECIFSLPFTFFFLFSGDNTLPKAIDILMRCYQGFFVAINFIIRMLVLRAFVIIFFFFRCPMLTFNDLPHFLPLLYLIIDCDLHTRTHSLALIRSIIITLSLSLPVPIFFLAALSHFQFHSIDQSLFFSRFFWDRTIRVSIARVIFIRE